MSDIQTLFLDEIHRSHHAKMGAFAGYTMPITYADGLITEHLHTRTHAGLFDISHMGQVAIEGMGAIAFLNMLLPIPIEKLKVNKCRYTVMLNHKGGILDDLIITRKGDHSFHLVINAACYDKDLHHINIIAEDFSDVTIIQEQDRVLLALQGPESVDVLQTLILNVGDISFMNGVTCDFSGDFSGDSIWVNRSGYTGEDGFELSIPHSIAKTFVETILQHASVRLIGLGARNSLRLEAGLHLYGHDINEEMNPYSAGLGFAISKLRLEGGEFIGHSNTVNASKAIILQKRVGLLPQGKAPLREGVCLYNSDQDTDEIGWISSGGFSPSLDRPIAFAYVANQYSDIGTVVWAEQRAKRFECKVVALPFVSHKYVR